MSDERLAATILELLGQRRQGASICPSDVARAEACDDWRPLMPRVRAVAARLAAAGRIRVTQGDAVVDIRTVRGPVRLRLP